VGTVYCAGVDVGSVSTAAVVVDGGGLVLGRHIVATGARCAHAAGLSLAGALAAASLQRLSIAALIATGYGRDRVDGRTDTVTEITCHARGISALVPDARFLVDIGGQDCKAILLGPGGAVLDFAMNDRCAAGTGRFFESMCRALEIDLDELGSLALSADRAVGVSHVCAVFAESEVIGLLAQGVSKADVAAAVCESAARQVAALANRVGPEEPIALSGGAARNVGFARALERKLGRSVLIPPEPELVGALGAALLALDSI